MSKNKERRSRRIKNAEKDGSNVVDLTAKMRAIDKAVKDTVSGVAPLKAPDVNPKDESAPLDLLGRVKDRVKAQDDKKDKTRRVTLMRDHVLEYPELYLEVFIVGPNWEERAFAPMFARAGCLRAKSIKEADLVVFTGGVDVDPALYGEEKHKETYFSAQRDQEDIKAYQVCLDEGIPMLGICRGAQFLHVMNGGKLYQDVDNHQGEHSMWDVRKKTYIARVSSVHHQAVIPDSRLGIEIIATAAKSQNRWRNPLQNDKGNLADIEAFFYRDTCCIGIQGHPEYSGYEQFTQWSLELIYDLVNLNTDLEWLNSNRRLTEEAKLRQLERLKQSITNIPVKQELN